MAIDNVLRVDGDGKCYGFSPASQDFEVEPNGANLKGVPVVIDHDGEFVPGVVSGCHEGGDGRFYAHIDVRLEQPYQVVETASGWGVERLTEGVGRAVAEFLGRDEANEALAGLWSGDTSEKDYDWLERE